MVWWMAWARGHSSGVLRRLIAAPAAILLLYGASHVSADGAASAVFVRFDSDQTLVVSPRAQVRKRAGDTEFSATYAADIWTSASIDIRTSASKPVTEQRDEVDAALVHELSDVTLSGSYRYSRENDYESHGGSASLAWDFARNNATLAFSFNLFKDKVGQSGVPQMAEDLLTIGGRGSFTQVLTEDLLAQVTYELSYLAGYLESPYRFVGIGGTGLGCEGSWTCLRERVPDDRQRHALALTVRQALGSETSVGLNYRLYFDSWEMSSHTAAVDLAWQIEQMTSLTLRYRFYLQSGVGFYQRVYAQLPGEDDYMTRDRELSPMSDHRVALEFEQRIALDTEDTLLVLSANAGGTNYAYDNFVGLQRVLALELTFAAAVEL